MSFFAPLIAFLLSPMGVDYVYAIMEAPIPIVSTSPGNLMQDKRCVQEAKGQLKDMQLPVTELEKKIRLAQRKKISYPANANVLLLQLKTAIIGVRRAKSCDFAQIGQLDYSNAAKNLPDMLTMFDAISQASSSAPTAPLVTPPNIPVSQEFLQTITTTFTPFITPQFVTGTSLIIPKPRIVVPKPKPVPIKKPATKK